MIEFRDVRKIYLQGTREVAALDGVTLHITPGGFTCLMGPSGSGKSTFLHLAGGLDLPTSGDVLIEGQPTRDWNDDALTLLRRRRLGFVFQFFNLIPSLTVAENVALPLLLEGVSAAASDLRVRPLLERVGLSDRSQQAPAGLSGGEMQRTAIARALVADPAIVLADEPTGNLDRATGRGILEILHSVAKRDGRTVVIVTHDPSAAEYADRVVRLRDGRIESDGSP
ncbi:MAG TPA: ABC transporter ATP-binding protein [Planctomycetota bacterium]|nr:ABC transporter ATP-binding protein [Planctomycetota bacterium]